MKATKNSLKKGTERKRMMRGHRKAEGHFKNTGERKQQTERGIETTIRQLTQRNNRREKQMGKKEQRLEIKV